MSGIRPCLVPDCGSKTKLGDDVSFHKLPQDPIVKQKWLESIRANTDSCDHEWLLKKHYLKVCSLHFLSTDFSISTRRKQLLPHAVPTVFQSNSINVECEDMEENMFSIECVYETPLAVDVSDESNTQNENPSVQRVCTKVGFLSSDEECMFGNEQIYKESLPLNAFCQCSILRQRLLQHRSTYKVLHTARQRLRKRVATLKQERKELKACLKGRRKNKLEQNLATMLEKTKSGCVKSSFLIEQIRLYGKKKSNCYSEVTLKMCVLLFRQSPKVYRLLRKLQLLSLPHPSNLKRFIGYATVENGITSLVKRRLAMERKKLSNKNQINGLIVIDETAFQEKLIRDLKSDTFLGQTSTDASIGVTDRLANRLLCFSFRGLSTSYRIPVVFFFVSDVTAEKLKDLTIQVVVAVEEQGFLVQRIVADDLSVNTSMFRLLGATVDTPMMKHPCDPEREIDLLFNPSH